MRVLQDPYDKRLRQMIQKCTVVDNLAMLAKIGPKEIVCVFFDATVKQQVSFKNIAK